MTDGPRPGGPGAESPERYPCPGCGAAADEVTGCAGCGSPADPDAIAVVRLDATIERLTRELTDARRVVERVGAALREAGAQRDAALVRVNARRAAAARTAAASRQRAEMPMAGPVGMTPAGAGPAGPRPVGPLPVDVPSARPETSQRTVQAVLFVLGGILLGSAAIVFTTVAWANFGIAGKAVVLVALTALTLAVPPLAGRRALAGTAETFAVLGLLLVLLDGYAAWYVDLAGIADATSPTTYVGGVCALTAVIAVGYRLAVERTAGIAGPVGPRFVALVLAQPVIALFTAGHGIGPAGWSLGFAALAAGDAAIVRYAGRVPGPARLGRQFTAGMFGGFALFVAGFIALAGLVFAATAGDAARAGGALIVVCTVLLGIAVATNLPPFPAITAGLLVVAVAGAAARTGVEVWPRYGGLVAGVVTAAVAVAVRVLPARVRTGPRVGASVVAALAGAVAAVATAVGALVVVFGALPAWQSTAPTARHPLDWQVPAVLAAVAVALLVLHGPGILGYAAPLTAGLMALAIPPAVEVPWWAPSVLDGLVAAGCAVLAATARRTSDAVVRGTVAAFLTAHAVLAGLGRPEGTAGTLAGVVLLAAVVAWLAGGPRGVAPVGTVAVTAGLLALPGLGAAVARVLDGIAGTGTDPELPWLGPVPVAGLGSAVGLLLAAGATVVTCRFRPGYRVAAVAAVATGGLVTTVAAAVNGVPVGVFGALALLATGVCLAVPAGRPADRPDPALIAAAVPAAPTVLAVLLSLVPALVTVLVGPWYWLGEIWSGAPRGVGAAPAEVQTWPESGAFAGPAAAVALVIGVLACAAVAQALAPGDNWTTPALAATPCAALAVLTGAVAAGARWPVLPVLTLATGIALTLGIALRTGARPLLGWVLFAAATTAAGIGGSLPTSAMTLVALGSVTVTGAVCAVAGRTTERRVVGWLLAAGFGTLLACAAALAAGSTPRSAAYWTLLAPAAALGASAWLARQESRTVEAAATETAAHSGAVVALLLTAGSAAHAAGICTLWGLALGLRALPPMPEVPRRTRLFAATCCGLGAYWLVLVSGGVAVVEAYTVPAAVLALAGGWLVARRRPELSSWSAYWPGLLAGVAPTMASVSVTEGAPLRRLGLGLAGIGLVLLGARLRLQAPVVVGGAAVTLVALHETVLLADLLPRWAPLAVGGVLLVGVAMTYERRRRDLARLRAAVTRLR